jgi:four helix bundle protein
LAVAVLEATDAAYHARKRPVFDQLRRAAVSVEANIVEGYALGTTPQFLESLAQSTIGLLIGLRRKPLAMKWTRKRSAV